jgi:hypothetical protein
VARLWRNHDYPLVTKLPKWAIHRAQPSINNKFKPNKSVKTKEASFTDLTFSESRAHEFSSKIVEMFPQNSRDFITIVKEARIQIVPGLNFGKKQSPTWGGWYLGLRMSHVCKLRLYSDYVTSMSWLFQTLYKDIFMSVYNLIFE